MQDSQVFVSLVAGRPATTSLTIAECFGKEHKNVLADIRFLLEQCPSDFNALNFQHVEYTDAKGEKRPMYTVFFDGFMLLVMGYTGKKALAMKLAYIEAFNAMRLKLEQRPQIGQADASLTPDQQCIIRAIVKARIDGKGLNKGQVMSMYQQVWSRFNNHFRIPRYSELPQSRMSEAVEYLVSMEVRPRKVEAEREQPRREEDNACSDIQIEQAAYEYRKRHFDQLGKLLRELECLRENIHLMGRPGARSLYLSEEKSVLYDNMNDCVNGAVTGINIAIYNLRSAARIGSRTKFRM